MGSHSFAAMYHNSPKASANLHSSPGKRRSRKKDGGDSGNKTMKGPEENRDVGQHGITGPIEYRTMMFMHVATERVF